ncbi:MAG: glycosyltransferase, partial [Candidatus Hadarchaeales archaeon]
MNSKILGFDYSTFISSFFRVAGISDVFLMPQNYRWTVGHKILHSIIFFMRLPYFIKRYKTFVFLSAPYFHFPSLMILKAAKKNVVTVVIELYGEAALEETWQAPLYKRIFRKIIFPVYEIMERISIKLSDAVFCVSWYSVEKYKKLNLNRNVFRVYNGADVAKIFRIKPKIFRKKTIFYMGGFPGWRGVDLLIRAFEIVKEKHPETQLVVMGGSDEEVEHAPELRKLLSKKNVTWIRYGPHEEAISHLKGAYIAVMPARKAFMTRVISSLKVFEYIAAEVP